MKKTIKVIVDNIIFIMLIFLIFAFICIFCFTIKQKLKINSMYSKEISATVNIGSDILPEEATSLMEDLNNTSGITVTNTAHVPNMDGLGNILIVDEIYYDKYKENINIIDGKGFEEEDFTNLFDSSTKIPILISQSYAKKYNLKSGDEYTLPTFMPNSCDLYTPVTQGLPSIDGSNVMTKEINDETKSCEDDSIAYLRDDKTALYNLPVEIKGVFADFKEIPGFKSYSSEGLVLMPFFLINDEDLDLFDVDKYLVHEPFYTLPFTIGQTVFIDYSLITPDNFEEVIHGLENEYNTYLYLDREIEQSQYKFELAMEIINQILVSLFIILFILIIFWCSSIYYKAKELEYRFAVYHLLGVKNFSYTFSVFKAQMIIDLFLFLLILLIGSAVSIISSKILLGVVLVLIFIIMKSIEYLYFYVTYKIVLKKDLNKIYIQGEEK